MLDADVDQGALKTPGCRRYFEMNYWSTADRHDFWVHPWPRLTLRLFGNSRALWLSLRNIVEDDKIKHLHRIFPIGSNLGVSGTLLMYRSRWDVFDGHFESSVIIHHRWMPPFFGRRQSVFCRIKNPALLVLIDLSFYLYALCSGIDVVLVIRPRWLLFIHLFNMSVGPSRCWKNRDRSKCARASI